MCIRDRFADQGLSQPFDFTEARMPGQDMTIYAGWNARSYTVSFEAVNGADPAAVTVEYGAAYGELPVLTHETLDVYKRQDKDPAEGLSGNS